MINNGILVVLPLVVMLILVLVILVKSRRDGFNAKSHVFFSALGGSVLLMQLCTVVSYAIELSLINSISGGMEALLPVLGISCIALSFYFWFRYLLSTLKPYKPLSAIVEVLLFVPVLLLAGAAIASPWIHSIFYIGSDHSYEVGNCNYLQLVCPVLYGVLALIVIAKRLISEYDRNTVRVLRFFLWFIVPAALGCLAQCTLGRGGYSQIGICFGFVLIYIEQYMDELFEVRRLKSIAAINGNLEMAYAELNRQMAEIKKLNEQLDEARKEAETANKAKTVFLNNMSHDIRTPLNAIIGFANLMNKEKENVTVVTDYLRKIRKSGDYLMSLINDVLDLAHIESGNQKLVPVPFSLTDIRDQQGSMIREMLVMKRLAFTATLDVDHYNVMIDPVKEKQLIMNLVSNAIKYTPEGGSISLTIEEVTSSREGYGKYIFTVSDSGIGMSSEFVAGLMDYFNSERNSEAKRVPGIGLGMALVKTLVDLMGGSIQVNSLMGKGSSFQVTLEHEIVTDPSLLGQPKMEDLDTSCLSGKRILMAEDNDLNSEIATAILMDAGMFVDRAEDGEICVQMLKDAKADYYDLVLMDIMMPNMNGYEASVSIRSLEDKAKASIPILAMTANAFEEDKQKAFRSGMNGHLSKPIDIPVLMKALVDILQPKTDE